MKSHISEKSQKFGETIVTTKFNHTDGENNVSEKQKHIWDDNLEACFVCGVEFDEAENLNYCDVVFDDEPYGNEFPLDEKATKRTKTKKGATKMTGYYANGKWHEGSQPASQSSSVGGHGTSWKSKCSGHSDSPVLDFAGMLITGYRKTDLPFVGVGQKTLVMNLTGTSIGSGGIDWPLKKLPAVLNLLDAKEEFGIDFSMGDEMLIDWPDQKAVAIRPAWWLKMLQTTKDAGYEKVNVCCFGGHGRTGTALACMLVAAKAVKNGDAAVDLVRKIHCEECIESNAQLNYIDIVCTHYGLPLTKAATV